MEESKEIIARKIRDECIKEFVRAYEEAGIKGMCEEGRIEYAVDAVRSMDLRRIVNDEEMTSQET